MDFRRKKEREHPEINLIPMIDVLLVIIIFLMLTTTYTKFSGIDINLPTASVEKDDKPADLINVLVFADGKVQIDETPLASSKTEAISDALQTAAKSKKKPSVIINADKQTTHQMVVNVMQAAQNAGLPNISFTTQSTE